MFHVESNISHIDYTWQVASWNEADLTARHPFWDSNTVLSNRVHFWSLKKDANQTNNRRRTSQMNDNSVKSIGSITPVPQFFRLGSKGSSWCFFFWPDGGSAAKKLSGIRLDCNRLIGGVFNLRTQTIRGPAIVIIILKPNPTNPGGQQKWHQPQPSCTCFLFGIQKTSQKQITIHPTFMHLFFFSEKIFQKPIPSICCFCFPSPPQKNRSLLMIPQGGGDDFGGRDDSLSSS